MTTKDTSGQEMLREVSFEPSRETYEDLAQYIWQRKKWQWRLVQSLYLIPIALLAFAATQFGRAIASPDYGLTLFGWILVPVLLGAVIFILYRVLRMTKKGYGKHVAKLYERAFPAGSSRVSWSMEGVTIELPGETQAFKWTHISNLTAYQGVLVISLKGANGEPSRFHAVPRNAFSSEQLRDFLSVKPN